MIKLRVEIDGGSRGNPGPAAAAIVVRDPDGKVLMERSQFLGRTTNNVAEWASLEMAVRTLIAVARKYGPVEAAVQADSQLVVRQFNGDYRIKDAGLQQIAGRVRRLLLEHPEVKVRLVHVPREENRLADTAVNRELDKVLKAK
ncbi:ribonuclease HI family protein [Desulforudis sp. 1088]|uniref:ribonuclease HI family protein n=1 Tax=unclassified Candidatus Desulforudis TaxID=2635950 RepID=UPI00349AA2AD